MTIRNLSYFLKQASKSIVKNRLMSVTSIITVFSSVLILSLAFTIGVNINSFISNIEDTFSFIAFINKEVSPEEVKKVYDRLTKMESVNDISYTSSEEALKEFASTLGDGDSKDIIQGLENDNPLPPSFTVYVSEPEAMESIVKSLSDDVGEGKSFSVIRHAQGQLEILNKVKSAVAYISIVLVSVLGFIAIVIIMNTIKIAVASRRIEINIMKYIGATDWFIRWPFIFEGIFIGLMGAFIAVLTTVLIYTQTLQWLESMVAYLLGGLDFLPPIEVAFAIMPVALIVGIALGVIGSLTSLRTHLKV